MIGVLWAVLGGGTLLGLIMTALFYMCRWRLRQSEKESTQLIQKVEYYTRELNEVKDKSMVLQMENSRLREENEVMARLHKGEMDAIQTTFKEQQRRFDEIVTNMSDKIQVATDKMLRSSQKEFAESSLQSIGSVVNPLRETIDKMSGVIRDNVREQSEMSSAMRENIRNLMEQTIATRTSADELARALKHGSKIQGDWGETLLTELLQSQGLTSGRHYDVQSTLRDEKGNIIRNADGMAMRPDIVLHLDNERDVIIDSKVSLTAFIDYVNAETEEEKEIYMAAHIESIRRHVKELSNKDYSLYIDSYRRGMDYVIMFIPHMGALWSAMNAQPDLWRKAMDMNVFIADEQTLFAALKMVNLTWIQITQAQNHERVYALASEMVERVGLFSKRFEALGELLSKTRACYEDASKKLQPSGQSIIQTGNKLIALGARQSERHPLPKDDATNSYQILDGESA